ASDRQQRGSDEEKVTGDRSALAVAARAERTAAAAGRQTLDTARQAVAAARLTVAETAATNATHLQPPTAGAVAAAPAAVATAAGALATARQTLRESLLLAPFSGTVASVDAVAGQLVSAQSGAGVVTLVDLGHLTVSASFDPAEATLLAPGQPAAVTVPALAGRTLPARVLSVDTLPDQAPASTDASAASP